MSWETDQVELRDRLGDANEISGEVCWVSALKGLRVGVFWVVEDVECVKVLCDCVCSWVCMLGGEPCWIVGIEIPQDERIGEGIEVV